MNLKKVNNLADKIVNNNTVKSEFVNGHNKSEIDGIIKALFSEIDTLTEQEKIVLDSIIMTRVSNRVNPVINEVRGLRIRLNAIIWLFAILIISEVLQRFLL